MSANVRGHCSREQRWSAGELPKCTCVRGSFLSTLRKAEEWLSGVFAPPPYRWNEPRHTRCSYVRLEPEPCPSCGHNGAHFRFYSRAVRCSACTLHLLSPRSSKPPLPSAGLGQGPPIPAGINACLAAAPRRVSVFLLLGLPCFAGRRAGGAAIAACALVLTINPPRAPLREAKPMAFCRHPGHRRNPMNGGARTRRLSLTGIAPAGLGDWLIGGLTFVTP